MLVSVWQTCFVFKNTKDHKNVKTWTKTSTKSFKKNHQKILQNIIKIENS